MACHKRVQHSTDILADGRDRTSQSIGYVQTRVRIQTAIEGGVVVPDLWEHHVWICIEQSTENQSNATSLVRSVSMCIFIRIFVLNAGSKVATVSAR